jgi:hypothetical protein
MELNEIRHLLHLIKIEDLTPAQITSAMGGIYLSTNALSEQEESVTIVKTFQAVKVPTLGAMIPGSTAAVSKPGETGTVKIFTPTANKTYKLLAVDCTAGPGTVEVDFGLVDTLGQFVKLASSGSLTSGSSISFDYRNDIQFDSGMIPAFIVTTGTAANAIVGLAYGELVQ